MLMRNTRRFDNSDKQQLGPFRLLDILAVLELSRHPKK